MSKKICTLILILASSILFAQKGKDGARTHSSNINLIPNRYATLAATANAGSTSLTVDNISKLAGSYSFTSSANYFNTSNLSSGDLIMVVQMQGADINTSNTSSYGSVTNLKNVGKYELLEVTSVSGNIIYFNCTGSSGLANTYTVGGRNRAQVIRIPRFRTLTVNANRRLTGMPWNGAEGGIIALEANTTMTLNGRISADTLGFRGGDDITPDYSSDPYIPAVTDFVSTDQYSNAQKGEGIAGNVTDYASLGGVYGRGAPANGGGGGNGHNAGGGGGSNAMTSGSGYTGAGQADISNSSWTSAWNRDNHVAPSGTIVNSTGGGRGGYSFAGVNENALNVSPGSSSWGGNSRGNVGGWGGRPLDNSGRDRIFLGGGGGAGEGNNYAHGQGGKGAGIVFLLSHGNIVGRNDSITAMGRAGYSTTSGGNDAPGGGGAGGTIIVLARNAITNLRARAHGGNGGSQNMVCCGDETEGPGGGGSGGYIATNQSSGLNAVASGGLNGTTNSTGITEFTPNGATRGSAGAFVNSWQYQDPTGNDLMITQSFVSSAPVCQNTPITIQIAVSNAGISGSMNVVVGDTLPSTYVFVSARTTSGTYDTLTDRWSIPGIAAGATVVLFLDVIVTSTTTPSNTARIVSCYPKDCNLANNAVTLSSGLTITAAPTTSNAGVDQRRCNGSTSFTLAGNAPSIGTGVWSLVSGAASITTPSSRTSTVTVTAGETAVLRWTISNSCGFSSDEMTITHSSPVTANAGPDQSNCSGVSNFNLAGNVPAFGSGTWSVVSGTSTIATVNNPLSSATLSSPTSTLRWTVTNGSCTALDDIILRNLTGTAPTTANAGEDIALCCLSNSILSANVATVGTGSWSVVSGPNNPTFSSLNSPTATLSGLQNGTYVLRWTIRNGSCTSSDDVELNINCNSGDNNKGKDGGITISGSQRIYNRYTNLAVNAAAGDKTITVTTVNTLKGSYISSGMVNGFANDVLGPGDLVMIVQMQGANIDTSNTSSYGSVSSYGNTGNYEIFEVGDVTGNVITLSSPAGLMKSYSTGYRNRTQVVRIPRWSSMTINSASSISAKPWDGLNGGVVAIEVAGTSTINGSIDVTGDGFRGGQEDNTYTTYTDDFYVTTTNKGGAKGEGIAGTQSDYAMYLRGSRGKGAPANGGGGGVSTNSGGGGGANVFSSGTYTGSGVPSVSSASWIAAWNLESSGFAYTSSVGGGRGGYSLSLVDANALTSAPGNTIDWGGSGRLNRGGLGGRPLDYASNTKLFMGGGGGSGEGDNSSYGNGGNGGGLVYFLAHGAISGSGTIVADGGAGQNTMNSNRDGAGGGGAGGAIYLNAKTTVTGLSLFARGGNGGNQLSPLTPANSEAQGPGGGGGGGYIISTHAISRNVSGGSNGVTNVSSLSEFTPNGATQGYPGDIQSTSFRDNFSTIVDLKIKMNTTAPPNVCPADTVRFRVVLNNANTTCTKSSGVQVKTTLASQLNFISALPSNGSYNSSTGVWTVTSPISANDSAILAMVTLTNASPVDSSKSYITTMIETDPISSNDTAKNAGFVGVGCTPLPVELLSFTAQPVDNQYAKLDWITTLEINNDHFDVERSSDGSNFQKIGEVKGMGNTTEMTTYTYMDSTPSAGVNYYKLRQVDYDGKFEYTDIRSVVITKSSPQAFMYPNPCSEFTYVDLRGFDITQDVKFHLMNSVGLLVRTAAVKGGDIYTLPVSVLPQGSYILSISSEQYDQSFKLLIQR